MNESMNEWKSNNKDKIMFWGVQNQKTSDQKNDKNKEGVVH